jgi:hypothetical protein
MKQVLMLLLLLVAPFVVNAQTKAKPYCYVEILFSDVVEEKECSQMRKILAVDCQDILVFAEEQIVYCAIKSKTDLVAFDTSLRKKIGVFAIYPIHIHYSFTPFNIGQCVYPECFPSGEK